jgi:hypothetical protein
MSAAPALSDAPVVQEEVAGFGAEAPGHVFGLDVSVRQGATDSAKRFHWLLLEDIDRYAAN